MGGGLTLWTLTAVLGGCALFGSADSPLSTSSNRPVLPPLRPAADAVHLQVVFVERPVGDTLSSDLVWKDLDTVGALPLRTRTTLLDHGFRVGQAGASPPPALQTLLGMTDEITNFDEGDEVGFRGRRLGIRNGQETEIQTSEIWPERQMVFHSERGDETIDFTQARCVLRLKPVRQSNGWVRIDLTPEIHHGDSRMRPTAGDEGWALKGGQKADVRHALKFSVMLNTGEFAVIGGDSLRPETPGASFFERESENGGRVQRVLILRLADAGQPTAD